MTAHYGARSDTDLTVTLRTFLTALRDKDLSDKITFHTEDSSKMAFDIERFVDLSKAVETSDLDWDYIKRVGVTKVEARILRYMADVESHTIIYLRDILSGHTAGDPEITQFMACWVYEETHHGRALDRFLTACGYPPESGRYTKVLSNMGWQEHLEAFLTTSLPKLTPHFAATHMSWGAVDEMMAASAYTMLAYYTKNEELSKLLLRMAKDERRHQSFYYHQAEKRLAHPLAQAICATAMRVFWNPVGVGVGEENTLGLIGALLYDDERGREELGRMDRLMAKLPGLGWFQRASVEVGKAIEMFRSTEPDVARELDKSKGDTDRLRADRLRNPEFALTSAN